jgi:hypothetical protein
MNDEAMELLFRTLGQILNNQNRIMNHLGIIDKTEWRNTDDSVELENEVFDFSTKYEH